MNGNARDGMEEIKFNKCKEEKWRQGEKRREKSVERGKGV